jgi:hypothetical protein
MTWSESLLAVGLGLLVNECCEVSPWAARRLVRWSARRRYAETVRAELRVEELTSLINDLPGKLFKLVTAVCFVAVAVVLPGKRPGRQSTGKLRADGLPDGLQGWLLRRAVRRLPEDRREVHAAEMLGELYHLRGAKESQRKQWIAGTFWATAILCLAVSLDHDQRKEQREGR